MGFEIILFAGEGIIIEEWPDVFMCTNLGKALLNNRL